MPNETTAHVPTRTTANAEHPAGERANRKAFWWRAALPAIGVGLLAVAVTVVTATIWSTVLVSIGASALVAGLVMMLQLRLARDAGRATEGRESHVVRGAMPPSQLDAPHANFQVFVSSVIDDYTEYREAAGEAIAQLGHMPIFMEEVTHSTSSPTQAECFAQIDASDVVVLLVGSRYGACQASGKSATHEEWDHARSRNKPVLVFFEDVADPEPRQAAFRKELRSWEHGRFGVSYSTPIRLLSRVSRSLREHSERTAPDAHMDPLERLPPNCRERLEVLLTTSRGVGEKVLATLTGSRARQPGVLAQWLAEPPQWMSEGSALPWEVFSSFLAAHGLDGTEKARNEAIGAGSLRKGVLQIENALARANEGSHAEASRILSGVSPGEPLLEVARAHIADDGDAAIAAIMGSQLNRSDEPETALFAVQVLVWAYWRQDRLDLAAEALRDANQRFPRRTSILLRWAGTLVDWAREDSTTEADRLERLGLAVEVALNARDVFRSWYGPSHEALALATQALIYLDDAPRVVELATPAPTGEATAAEADHPDVRQNLAHAFLMLRKYDDLDTLRIDDLPPAEAALIRAMRSRASDDGVALERMREALALAGDDPSRLHALIGLASLGVVDESALSEFESRRPADVALIRALAALTTGDHPSAVSHLISHRHTSVLHAELLADAQAASDEPGEAVDTLIGAADQLDAPSLLVRAVEVLVQVQRYAEAASVAADALASSASRPTVRRLRALLVEIAQAREDWPALESSARSLATDFPDDERAQWATVYAMYQQGRSHDAWTYMKERSLSPHDPATAQITVAVCGTADVTDQDAGHILKIAELYAENEEVAAPALMTLMVRTDRFTFTDSQRTRVYELVDDFVRRFPDSTALQKLSADSPEGLVKQLVESAQLRVRARNPLVEQIRCGLYPYGFLQELSALPYATLLLSLEAGHLTAISDDQSQRERERIVATEALGRDVAVDTSVVAFSLHGQLPLDGLTQVFRAVLAADDLVADARRAVAEAELPRAGSLVYDAVLDRVVPTHGDERQRAEILTMATKALGTLSRWQRVRSAPLRPPRPPEIETVWPWHASLWVAAAQEGRALWCDDLALRGMAEAFGIPTFGTWALYEALLASGSRVDLPSAPGLKQQLVRAGIADVPMELSELRRGLDGHDSLDVGSLQYLQRPAAWRGNGSELFQWYMQQVTFLRDGSHLQHLPDLLYAAARGLASAVVEPERQRAVGDILAATALSADNPDVVPALLVMSRYAAWHSDRTTPLDPLGAAVQLLLQSFEPELGAKAAAQRVIWLFSKVPMKDRKAVTLSVVEDR